jgi:hypothetical protein
LTEVVAIREPEIMDCFTEAALGTLTLCVPLLSPNAVFPAELATTLLRRQ